MLWLAEMAWDGGAPDVCGSQVCCQHTLTPSVSPCFSLQDAGIGFILVIDRRQDKWTSVKASVLRIAVSTLWACMLLEGDCWLLFFPVCVEGGG